MQGSQKTLAEGGKVEDDVLQMAEAMAEEGFVTLTDMASLSPIFLFLEKLGQFERVIGSMLSKVILGCLRVQVN